MNEQERYKKAFSALPHEYDIDPASLAGRKPKSTLSYRKLIVIALMAVLLPFTAAFAANADFRSDFSFWILGRTVKAEAVPIDECNYRIIITMPDGNVIEGGYYSDQPVDLETVIASYQNRPQIAEDDEGHVLFYKKNKVRDITALFKALNPEYSMQLQDGSGNEIPGKVTEYCYYELENRWYCIQHTVSDDGTVDCYNMAEGDTPYSMRFTYLPSYDEYIGREVYYSEVMITEESGKYTLYYHDQRIDITEDLQEWNVWETREFEGPENFVIVRYWYKQYFYLKVDDQYISVFTTEEIWPASETKESHTQRGLYWNNSDKGYIPCRTLRGVSAPEPDGPLAPAEEWFWIY